MGELWFVVRVILIFMVEIIERTALLEVEMDLDFRVPSLEEIGKVSEQITLSYTSAYKGLMDDSYLSSLTDDHWSSILHDSICKGDTCIIAEYNGMIVGSTVFGSIDTEDGLCAEWHAFYLLPQYTGCGFGHLFYQKIEEEMIKQGCTACILEVLSSNERAIRFYLSHGFNKSDTFTVQENGMTLRCDKMVKNLINNLICKCVLK